MLPSLLSGFTFNDPSDVQVVAIVGDFDRTVCHRLVEQLDCGSSMQELRINNRYYTATVGIIMFRTAGDLSLWDVGRNSTAEIGSLIVRFSEQRELTHLQDKLHLYQCGSQVLVLDDENSDPGDFAKVWAASNDFEVVYLNPNQANKEDAASFNEKCGMARLAEILHTVSWPLRHEKMKNVTGKEDVDRILHYLPSITNNSDDDVDADEEDKEAIWRAFTTVSLPPSRRESDCGDVAPEVASVCVDIILDNKAKISEAVESASVLPSEQGQEQKKRRKKGKSKEADAGVSELDRPSVIPKTKEELSDMAVFDTLIKSVENGTADLTIGDISKVREQLSKMPFNDKSRIDKAETIVRGIAEKMGTGDLGPSIDECDSN